MEAFAKIVGTHFKYFVRTLKVTLGREGVGPEFVDLGNDLSISRVQAEIFWDGKGFCLRNVGRNSIICNRRLLKTGEIALLFNKSPVKIGKSCFYFLLPS
jgi:hypothetical protein